MRSKAAARLTLALSLLALGATALTLGVLLAPRRAAMVSLAYVAVAGNNHVQVIDLASGETLRKIYSGATPWRLEVAPGGRRLWVQHWSAGTTAVVDLAEHEIVRVLPFRGPGAFGAGGKEFLTFSWPGSALVAVDARTLVVRRETVTEIGKVYDFAPDPDGAALYLAQFDPMARGPRERYAYVLAYPYKETSAARAAPVSLRTGRSPAAVEVLRTGPFLLTADRETNGLTLLNKNGDGRSIPTCTAPQAIVLAHDETRMAVLCWGGGGARTSRLALYRTDFTTRPWPTVTETGTFTVVGGLVAGAFSVAGDRLYVVDRQGARLLVVDPESGETRREIATGDVPVDVAIVEVSERSRRLAAGESRARRRLREALAHLEPRARESVDVSWTETTTWSAPVRRQRVAFRSPDRLRVEGEDGRLRLAAAGHSLAVEPTGRFWVAPRQELISLLWGLAGGPADETIRRLAGDVPGSPWMRGGLAVDVGTEVDQPARSLLVGASKPGEPVSQLWIGADTGLPMQLTEQIPIFRVPGHGQEGANGRIETRLHALRRVAPGVWLPARLERLVEGQPLQDIRIEDVSADRRLPDALFDLAQLGGTAPTPQLFRPETAASATQAAGPGLAVAVESPDYLSGPGASHPPYLSNPPTSGARLPWLADWGVHTVPIPLELQAHNLEHGGVAIQYSCPTGCPEMVARLREIAQRRDFVLVAPYPLMEPGLALTAWGRIERLAAFDEARITAFLDAWAGADHHTPLSRPTEP